MWILDLILLSLGIFAGVGAFLTGSDSLYKLFLGLIVGFLLYLVVSCQIEVTNFLSPALLNSYQSFLAKHATGVLSFSLLMIPILGLIFMLYSGLKIRTRKKSITQLLLGLLLPIFLIGIFAHLADGSILSESEAWKKIFNFLGQSGLFQVFHKLPGWIFLLLGFLIFYKSLFLLVMAFFAWFFKHVILQYFTSWKKWDKKSSPEKVEEEDYDDFEEQ